MSTRKYGNRIVSDLSKAILSIIKRGASTKDEVIDLLGTSFPDEQIRKRIYSLKYNKFLTEIDTELHITSKAIDALDKLEFNTLKDKRPWDKKWRLVIYDIPESKHAARDKIRQLLKDLGFLQLQMSVWSHPLPCFKQFQKIRKAYGIENHLLLLEVRDSSDFKDLKKKFSQTYPQLKSH